MSEERAQWLLDATRDGCIESLRERLSEAHAHFHQQRQTYRKRAAQAKAAGEERVAAASAERDRAIASASDAADALEGALKERDSLEGIVAEQRGELNRLQQEATKLVAAASATEEEREHALAMAESAERERNAEAEMVLTLRAEIHRLKARPQTQAAGVQFPHDLFASGESPHRAAACQTDGDVSAALQSLQSHLQLLRTQHRDAAEGLHREEAARAEDRRAFAAARDEWAARNADAENLVERVRDDAAAQAQGFIARLDLVETECRELKVALSDVRAEADAGQRASERWAAEARRLEQALAAANDRIADSQRHAVQDADELRDRLRRVEVAEAEANERAAQAATRTAELQRELEAASASVARAQRQHADAAAALEHEETTRRRSEAVVRELEDRLANIRAGTASETAVEASEVASLRAAIAGRTRELDDTRRALAEARDERDSSAADAARLRQRYEALKREQSEERHEHESAAAMAAKSTTEHVAATEHTWRHRCERIESEAKDAEAAWERERADLQAAKRTLSQQVTELRVDLARSVDTAAKAKRRAEAAERSAESGNSERCSHAESETKRVRAELSEVRRAADEAREAHTEEVARLRAEARQLEDEVMRAHAEERRQRSASPGQREPSQPAAAAQPPAVLELQSMVWQLQDELEGARTRLRQLEPVALASSSTNVNRAHETKGRAMEGQKLPYTLASPQRGASSRQLGASSPSPPQHQRAAAIRDLLASLQGVTR